MVGYARLFRFEGTHVNPNTLGMILTSALPFGFYQIKRAEGWFGRVFASLLVLLVVLAVLASFSRGAVFPLAFLLLATMFREVRNKKIYLAIAALAVVSYMLTPSFYWERFSTVTEVGETVQQDRSLYARVLAAKSALSLFAQYPLTGVGLHNFMARSSSLLRGLIYIHNGYLELLVGVGIFGFTAWAGMIYAGLRDCHRCLKAEWHNVPVKMRSLCFYTLVAIISGLFSNLFDSSEFNYVLWVPLAGGLAAGNMLRRRIDTTNP
jgi:O-antigen ligase